MERCNAGLSFRIVRSRVHKHADPPLGLLRARGKWPSSCRAAEDCEEFASPHQLALQAEGLTLPCCGPHCASRQILAANVRFGSLADIWLSPAHVRFTPKSGHWDSAT